VLDAESLVGGVDEAAGARRCRLDVGQGRHPQGVARGLDHLLRVTRSCRSRCGSTSTGLPLPLPQMATFAAGHAREARPDRPAGKDGHVDERRPATRGRPSSRGSPTRRLEHDGRLRDVRQGVRLGEALGHHLARPDDVRPGLEEDDRRGPGTDCELISSSQATPWSRSASRGTVTSCSHLLGRQAERLESASTWRRELGQDIDQPWGCGAQQDQARRLPGPGPIPELHPTMPHHPHGPPRHPPPSEHAQSHRAGRAANPLASSASRSAGSSPPCVAAVVPAGG
jgi:hypothetical protein